MRRPFAEHEVSHDQPTEQIFYHEAQRAPPPKAAQEPSEILYYDRGSEP
jgi:hypothetical protein